MYFMILKPHGAPHCDQSGYKFRLFQSHNQALYKVTQKNGNFLINPTKIEEIQEKKLLTEIEPLQLAF